MARILLVGKGAPERGGIPSFLRSILHGPLPATHDIELLNLASTDDEPQGGRATWANLRRTARDLHRLWAATPGRDLVHLHTAGAPAVTLLRTGALAVVARLRGARALVHIHGGRVVELLGTRRGRLVARLALRPAAQVVPVASSGHDALLRVLPEDRLELIRNGIDTEAFGRDRERAAAHPAQVPRLLYVGLLSRRKGLLDLFEASTQLRNRGIKHELRLVGGVPDEGRQAEEEIRQQVPSWARLLGRRPPEQMPGVYAEADVFCLPSWWEGTPLTVLEAMASGLPVVATRVGDVDQLLVDGETGVLAPPRDPMALAEALAGLLEDAMVRRRMGAAGRRRAVEHLDIRSTMASLDEVYQRLAPGR